MSAREAEAVANLLDQVVISAAKDGVPYQWDPAEVVRAQSARIKRLALT